MNNETHKTVRVHATMETELYIDINVPIDTNKDAIWQFIRDGNIDGGEMYQYDGFLDKGWRWQEPIYDCAFEPDAINVSKEIKKYE